MTFNWVVLLYALSSFILLFALVHIWGVRSKVGGMELFWVLLSLMVWGFMAALETSLDLFESKYLVRKLAYFAVAPIGVLTLRFVIRFTQTNHFLEKKYRHLLWLVPIATVILALTNDSHHLFWTDIYLAETRGISYLAVTIGPFFMLFNAFVYLLLLISFVILIRMIFRSSRVYTPRVLVIFIPLLIGFIADLVTALNFEMVRGLDLTPVAFALVGLSLTLGFTNFEMINLMPIARDKILNSMGEYLLIFNHDLFLVDFNPSAEQLLTFMSDGDSRDPFRFISKTPSQLFPDWPEMAAALETDHDLRGFELSYQLDDKTIDFSMGLTIIRNSDDEMVARVITMNDITLQKEIIRSENEARQTAEALQGIARVIGSTLDEDRVLELALEEIKKVVQFDTASIALWEGNDLIIRYIRDFNDPGVVKGYKLNYEISPNKIAIETKLPLISNDVQAEFEGYQIAPSNKIRSIVCIPLLVKDRAIGTLTLDSFQPDFFSDEKIPIVKAFGSQVAVALENARYYQRMAYLAIRDPLTELYNRRHFIELVEKELERASRYGHPLTLIMFDLDYFKLINDNFGHLLGDQALLKTARNCASILRSSDVFARYGGEEFTVLLPQTTLQDGLQTAERMRQVIEDARFETGLGFVKFTASFGVSNLGPDCQILDDLLSGADEAMYQAKRAGRNRVMSVSLE